MLECVFSNRDGRMIRDVSTLKGAFCPMQPNIRQYYIRHSVALWFPNHGLGAGEKEYRDVVSARLGGAVCERKGELEGLSR